MSRCCFSFFLRCLFGLRCRLSFLWIPLPTSSADLCFSTCRFQLLCSLPTSLLSLLFCESLPILLFRLSSSDSRLRNFSSDFLFDFRPCGFDFWLLISDFSSHFSLCFSFDRPLPFCINLCFGFPFYFFFRLSSPHLSLRELVFATWSLRFCMLRDGGGWDSSVADLIAALVPLMDPKP